MSTTVGSLTPGSSATSRETGARTADGQIAARIDRLPLTRVQWELAIIVEITWGFIIVDTDGIGARLYPFVWKPLGSISINQYAMIQAVQVGLGVLIGSYLMSWVASRWGRRPAILLSTLLAGIFLWPFALITDFVPLLICSVFCTIGVGGIVATHAVYLSEMIAPQQRSRVMLAAQSSTALVGVTVALLARELIPGHWQYFVWIGVAIQVLILFPLLYFRLPESPRWLEAHGRADEANRVTGKLEERCQRLSGNPLPPPDPAPSQVILGGRGAWREIVTNRDYLGRAALILICWLLCYPGIIYGVGAFSLVYMVDHGANAEFVFTLAMAASLVVFLAFHFNAWLGERIERRDALLTLSVMFALAMSIFYLLPTKPVMAMCYIVGRIGTSLFLFNLYNYTAVAFPTRLRSFAFAWTDGLGHLGAWAGVTLLGPLFVLGPNHLGWILFIAVPGALLPGLLIRIFGIKQSKAVLEHVSH